MAETFDTQLSDLHRKEADAEEKDYQERLSKAEDDYRQYSAFVEWVNARGGELQATLDKNAAESYVNAGSCIFWADKGTVIFCNSGNFAAAEPWQILWDMWEAQLK